MSGGDSNFYCYSCNKWRPKIAAREAAKGKRMICSSCFNSKLPPSMTRQNMHGDKYYSGVRAEKEWSHKPALDKYKGKGIRK